jgi:hypothetical protein
MRSKFINLLVILILLLSLQGFSQTTEKSKHPLLDKYYPRIENTDTSKAVSTQIKPMPTTTAPAVTTTIIPTVTTTPVPAVTFTTEPGETTTTVPAMTTTPAMTSTTSINKPTTVTVQAPVQKVQTQPSPPPYMDTRLGSSTKQYDTWEKNNNGAGSVTTSPK